MNQPLFEESQRFRQFWLWLVVFLVTAFAWYAFVHQIVMEKPFGDTPAPDPVIWIIFLLMGIGFPLLFILSRMTTTLLSDRLEIHFRPLVRKTIPLSQIAKAYPRDYRPLREYGGWGIRWSSRNGTAYNVSGNRGVQLELTDNKRILIGSQRSEELAAAINSARNR